MIDTPNGGQTCHQCRNFQPVHMVKDRLFGEVPVKNFCCKRGIRVDTSDGETCPMFLKRVFDNS